MAASPRALIDSPTKYSEHRFGLFSITQDLPNLPSQWAIYGVEWQSETCAQDAGVWTESCGQNLSPMSGGESSPGMVTADPFLLHARWECASLGRTPAEHEAAAQRALACSEQRVVEERFYNEFLVNPDTIPLNTDATAVPLANGIGVLEAALGAAQCGDPYIHLPRELGAQAARYNQTFGAGGILRSALGSPFSFGVGYGSVGPDGTPAPAGVTWIYGTGPVFMARTDMFMNPPTFADALDREINRVYWWAQRRYLLAVDSCVNFAIAVTVGEAACACSGGGGGGGLVYPSP